MGILPVDDAIRRLLAGVEPLGSEKLPLAEAHGRVLAEDLEARRTQPPFPASAMDGYAVRASEAVAGARLRVIGISRAGERFGGEVASGQAVRIFTGAPVPDAADAILIQENAKRDGDTVEVAMGVEAGQFIRPAGLDFSAGDKLLKAGSVLDAGALALAAAMDYPAVSVRRRPRVAVLANGDELVQPGAAAGPDQIISSNNIGLLALVREFGGLGVDLGIAADRLESISRHVDHAVDTEVLVVIGGASVGDHDLVKAALVGKGMQLDFWRIAMRPGKPLMVGQLGGMRVLGLPGNPVSSFVCGHIFLKPLVRAMLGCSPEPDAGTARLASPLPANDARQDYLRARISIKDGERFAYPFAIQDSSMLATFAAADALIVRAANAPAARAGDRVGLLELRRSSIKQG